jgi:hypothetical protein
MRSLVPKNPYFRYFERSSLRIKERVVKEAINLSLTRECPDLNFGGAIEVNDVCRRLDVSPC